MGLAAAPVGGGKAWPGFETKHKHTSALRAPLVRRARQGLAAAPVGGGKAWPAFETTRRAKLAARTARGRAAAHGRTKQPGPSTHTKTPTRDRVGVSEPPVGIEPTTYSLRVNRSAD